jgi:protein required for attachment to host cells
MNNKLIVVADSKHAVFYNALGIKLQGKKKTMDAKDFGIHHNTQARREGFYHIGSNPSHYFDPRSDTKKLDRAEFAKKIVDEITESEGQYDQLILIADPKTLGEIRSSMPDKLTKRVYKEIPKDLVGSSEADIEDEILS